MASGDKLADWGVHSNEPPASSAATPDTRATTNTPVLDFDASTDEAAIFSGVLYGYDSGGVTVDIMWTPSSASSGTCRWGVAFEKRASQDLTADGFATAVTGAGTAQASSSGPVTTSIACADGSEMDSLADGGAFRLKVYRDADGTSGTDDMTGDAELIGVVVRET